jgi:hypothetical protein
MSTANSIKNNKDRYVKTPVFLPVTPNKISAIPIFELIEAKTIQSRKKADKIRTARFSFEIKLLKLTSKTPSEIKPKTNTVLALKILIGS